MDLARLIQHPEQLDKETLYDLRSYLALHPCVQPARLLLLQNLYLLHDATFDEELRRSAIYITDRRKIFNLIEAAHYQLRHTEKHTQDKTNAGDRTISLIDDFLSSIPEKEEDKSKKRKPTPADAAYDYVAYLLESEEDDKNGGTDETPQMKGQSLIDDFINNDSGKITLKDEPEYVPEMTDDSESSQQSDSGYFTETLAKIYIKQGRYEKALEIIRNLRQNYPQKNVYYADQMRFLEKLIINNKLNN